VLEAPAPEVEAMGLTFVASDVSPLGDGSNREVNLCPGGDARAVTAANRAGEWVGGVEGAVVLDGMEDLVKEARSDAPGVRG